MALHVYGVVRADAPEVQVEGIGGSPVVLVRDGDLAVLTSVTEDRPPRPSRAHLTAHARVLESVLEEAPVVPVRFGTQVTDERAVVDEVLADRERLARALRRLEGRAEYVVTVAHDEETLLRRVLDGDPALRRLVGAAGYEERLRLGEHIAEAVATWREHDAVRLGSAIAELGESARVDRPLAGPFVRVSVLVANGDRGRVEAAIEQVARAEDGWATFTLNGPLPPYSFVED